MTRQSAASLRKLNGQLVHLALEVEAKVNRSHQDHYFERLLDRRKMDIKTIELTQTTGADLTEQPAEDQ